MSARHCGGSYLLHRMGYTPQVAARAGSPGALGWPERSMPTARVVTAPHDTWTFTTPGRTQEGRI